MNDLHLLTAFWIIQANDTPSSLGVSAYSRSDAFELVHEAEFKVDQEEVEIIEGVTVEELDVHHVVSNMGLIVRRGVWYPNLNSS